MAKKALGEKLAGALHASPTGRGDVEAAVWPHVAKACVTKELPNWWEVRIGPEEASRAGEAIARMALEAVESGARASGLAAEGVAVEVAADPKARPGRPRVRSEMLAEPDLHLRLAMARASGSAVASAERRTASIRAECSWDGAEVDIGPGTTVGRAPIRDLVLPEGSASRLHGVFRESAGGVAFEDADSTNGTTLNGNRVEGATRALRPGDILAFAGECSLAIL